MNNTRQIYLLILFSLAGIGSASGEVTSLYLKQALSASPYWFEPVAADSDWFDQTQLRYSGSDQDEHGLAFRFRPRFSSQRRAENRIVDLLNRQQNSLLKSQLNDELKLRYNKLIDLVETYNQLEFIKLKLALGQQKLVYNRSLAETEAFSIAELQSAELEFHSDQQQLLLLGKRLKFKLEEFTAIPEKQLNEFLSGWLQQVIDWDDFADPLVQLADLNQLDQTIDQLDFQLAQQKLKLARSDSANWLDFVELKLVDRPGGEQEAMLGIAIPIGTNDLGISQRAAEVNRANLSLQASRLDISRAISDSVSELEGLRDQADILKSTEMLLKQHYKKLRDIGRPAVVLKLRSEITRYQNESRNLRIRGLRDYIEALHTAGYLASEPLTNWLLNTKPEL